jgi:photosystem II stability/assembly factor-like uncharacterized protein
MSKLVSTTAVAVLLMATQASGADSLGKWRLILPNATFTIRANPLDANKLYVGNWANQLFRSDNGGGTWYKVTTGSLAATNYLGTICLPVGDTAIILVAGFRFAGIKISENSGAEFHSALEDTNLRKMYFISEAISQAADGRIYACRGTSYNSVWRSTDNGRTWDSISVIPSNITTRLCTITTHPTDPNLMFIGAKDGVILRSSDAGLTWTQVPVLDGRLTIRTGSEIPKITFSPTNPLRGYAVVFIGTDSTIQDNGGLLRTTDGGLNWDRVAFSDTCFWAVCVRPGKDGNDEVTVGGFRQSNQTTSIKGDGLVFRSLDNGITWQRYTKIPWIKENEIGTTMRNSWSLYHNRGKNLLYLASELGLFVLDEGTSDVYDAARVASGLFATQEGSRLVIHDQAPYPSDDSWTLYNMQAHPVASGSISQGADEYIDISGIASGQYLLVWGSSDLFRTLQVLIVR